MPYLSTPQEWLKQSSLLLQARPTTARITTKYASPRKPKPGKEIKGPKAPQNSETAAAHTGPPPATLTFKTYDAASGTTLKYRTNKAAEVGRLVGALGRLARHMAAVPSAGADDDEYFASAKDEAMVAVSGVEKAGQQQQQAVEGGGEGGGGKKKKKKGKK